MSVDVILGLQWGDEGKGKIVDYLANQYDVIARFQGGPNAGHTLNFGGEKYVLHTIPSGIFHENKINLVGNGVVIDPVSFRGELDKLKELKIDVNKRLYISKKAHLILPTHKLLDAASEKSKGEAKIGSTLKGIGPTYMDKTGRNGLRIGDIFTADFKKKYEFLKEKHFSLLKSYGYKDANLPAMEAEWFASIEILKKLNIVNGEYFINDLLKKGKKVMAEGAQGSMLDIDFGTYPYVTSSNTISASTCIGLGISPKYINEVLGVTKAYCTRVGGGPFPSEETGEIGEQLRKEGHEFGATTGRPRRCGWIDIPALKYTCMLNGVTQLVVTKADVLNNFDEIGMCTQYEYDGKKTEEIPFDISTQVNPIYKMFKGWKVSLDGKDSYETLPEQLKEYFEYLEQSINIPITMISTGPEREKLIMRAVEAVV